MNPDILPVLCLLSMCTHPAMLNHRGVHLGTPERGKGAAATCAAAQRRRRVGVLGRLRAAGKGLLLLLSRVQTICRCLRIREIEFLQRRRFLAGFTARAAALATSKLGWQRVPCRSRLQIQHAFLNTNGQVRDLEMNKLSELARMDRKWN